MKDAQACGYTQATLVGVKTDIKKGELDYEDYFFKNKDGTKQHPALDDLDDDIDRCKKCGCTIGEHAHMVRPIGGQGFVALDEIDVSHPAAIAVDFYWSAEDFSNSRRAIELYCCCTSCCRSMRTVLHLLRV